jgi:hypothetical protein
MNRIYSIKNSSEPEHPSRPCDKDAEKSRLHHGPPRASWAWRAVGTYRVRGREAELQVGKSFVVKRSDATNPSSVVLINLIEWEAGSKTDTPSAFYSYRRMDDPSPLNKLRGCLRMEP